VFFRITGRADSHTARLDGLQGSLGAGQRRFSMGMTVGEGKGGAMAEMNVVPLIDILLVLLIIFMVITPLTPKGLDTLVPQPNPNQQQNVDLENKTVVVQVLSNNKLKINNEDATWDSLGPRIEQIFKERAEKIAFVKGDNDVLFAEVARAIDIMRGNGIDKVGLITAKLEAGQ
jgi:biopolymer transport protein ExbD